ncbi:hypothetical protein CIB48_g3107 [Xylaria polymorpha]|nr:hypothetical protein CIB48_g3107 [Xylaria polymorpha]
MKKLTTYLGVKGGRNCPAWVLSLDESGSRAQWQLATGRSSTLLYTLPTYLHVPCTLEALALQSQHTSLVAFPNSPFLNSTLHTLHRSNRHRHPDPPIRLNRKPWPTTGAQKISPNPSTPRSSNLRRNASARRRPPISPASSSALASEPAYRATRPPPSASVTSSASATRHTPHKPWEQRGINDIVRQHYNAVPERGRDWRKTGSRIKGLRVFNNWVKSTLIQKFSPDEDHTPGAQQQGRDMAGAQGHELIVLDIGCGKGGDLGKWQQAPQRVQLYVGLDPADVSIDQAKDRYRSMGTQGGGRGGRGGRGGYRGGRQQHLFDARFFVKDCYGESLGDVDIVRQVGFDPSPMGRSGFDIVSMMFCMHYAFETEEKARMMLQNVSSALKKGGRFIGCIPNSDVISDRVTKFNERIAKKNEDPTEEDAEPPEDKEEGEAEETAEWGNGAISSTIPRQDARGRHLPSALWLEVQLLSRRGGRGSSRVRGAVGSVPSHPPRITT